MKKLSKRWIMVTMIAVGGILGTSCDNNDSPIPIVKTNFTVNIYTNNLINVGGYEYFTGGISGFFVYRVDFSTFCAYDRACPYDWETDGYVILNPDNVFQLKCEKCGSTYNILDGFPIGANTKASSALRSYNTRMEDEQWLRVYN